MEYFMNSMWAISLTSVVAFCILAVGAGLAWDRRASIKAYMEHRRQIRIQRGLAMGKKKKAERQAFVKQSLAEIVTDGFEELWFKGRITREEVNAVYRMLAKTHHIPDLLPHLTPEQVKKAIKLRRSHGVNTPAQEKPAWGDSPAVPIDKNSGGSNVIDMKKFGAKALAMKKSA